MHLWKEISFLAQVLAPSSASPGSLTERRSQGEGKRGNRPPPTCTLGLSPSVALSGVAIRAGSAGRERPAGAEQRPKGEPAPRPALREFGGRDAGAHAARVILATNQNYVPF